MSRNARTPYAILGLLTRGPMSGYDLRAAAEESVAHFWQESVGQIYPALKRLQESGDIEVHEKVATSGGRPRTSYRLTGTGRQTLRAWMLEAPLPTVEHNELLLKVFFGAIDPSSTLKHVAESRTEAVETLDALEALSAALRASRGDHPEHPYWQMTITAGRHGLRAHVAWCDEVLPELRRLASSEGNR